MEFTFFFREIPAAIAHRKSGVSLYLDRTQLPDVTEARALARGLVADLRRALGMLSDGFLISYAEKQLAAGHITVMNQARRLRDMYEYFATGAAIGYAGSGRLPDRTPGGGWLIFRRETEGYYNSVAMVAAYFSWLEHVLVLGFPFSGPVETQLCPEAVPSTTLVW